MEFLVPPAVLRHIVRYGIYSGSEEQEHAGPGGMLTQQAVKKASPLPRPF